MSKLHTSILFKNRNKKFKYISKRFGPNTNPCSTPYNNYLNELKVKLILTLCVLLFKYLKIHQDSTYVFFFYQAQTSIFQ